MIFTSCNYSKNKTSETKQNETVKRKPNLLIVLSDQHSYDMVGVYGNEQIITPNLDKLAKDGIRFKNAFSNQPVCTPFRGMLMSGMQPLKNGAFINDAPLLPNKSKLLAQVLKEQGYQTAYIGKWHLLGGDRDRPIPKGEMRYGFDTLITNNCHVDFRPGHAFFWNEQGEKEYYQEWEVYGQTHQALNYLDNLDPDKPFALIVSWHPPHDWGKFKGKDGKMHYRYDTMDELMAMYDRDSIKMRPGLEVTPDRKRMYHGYMAMVTGVDKAFGMLMDKLKEMKVEDNTLTIFSADHGDMLESFDAIHPKQYPHDYSIHIPLLMKFPQKFKEQPATDLMIGALDFMPTILGLMDIETDENYDGKDLSKAILNGNEDITDMVPLWLYKRGVANNYNNNWRGVVTKDYTFAMGKGVDSIPLINVLFDRKKDPNQLKNLYHDPEFAEVRDSLKQLTYNWMEKYNDHFYGEQEFLSVRPKETWMYNYTKSPYELFKKQQDSINKN
jgi:arylsulfatase A-like enzyme